MNVVPESSSGGG